MSFQNSMPMDRPPLRNLMSCLRPASYNAHIWSDYVVICTVQTILASIDGLTARWSQFCLVPAQLSRLLQSRWYSKHSEHVLSWNFFVNEITTGITMPSIMIYCCQAAPRRATKLLMPTPQGRRPLPIPSGREGLRAHARHDLAMKSHDSH
jgi:hypothetical protein